MTVLFTVWNYDVTLIEFISVITAFIAIWLCIQGTRWGWPFYAVSSVLYGWLFLDMDLYASATTQLIFFAAALWGWFSWGQEGVRLPSQLTTAQRVAGGAGIVALWVLTAPALQSIGGAATWADAFMLIGSLAGQALMVQQKVEAWAVWASVNFVGVGLYAGQGLYFTSLFYVVLIVMSVTGWRAWATRAESLPAAPAHKPHV